MIDAPALPPPAVVVPAPREVSFGLVSGTAPRGTVRIVVRVGRHVVAEEPLRRRSFSLTVPMTTGPVTVGITAVDGRGRRATTLVSPVFALGEESRPSARAPTLDPLLAGTIRGLVREHGGIAGVYVQNLATGRGAAWNAAARFPAASTLKLAIAVAVLASTDGKPAARGALDTTLRAMLHLSENEAANALLVRLGGSTGAGSHRVDVLLRALGLRDSLMYGGYEVVRRPAVAAAPIPIRVERQPSFGVGKYTTAADLARLARAVYLAAAGTGPLLRLGVTGSEARYLLYLLAHVEDRGKLGRFLGPDVALMHKAGWLPQVRHDSGIVAYSGGAYVVAVLTWRASRSDELAGRIALFSFDRFFRRRG